MKLAVKIIGLALLMELSIPMLFAQDDQIPTDDLGLVSDSFQEHFFEALKQKGIQNYEKALEVLSLAEQAASSDEQRAVVYHEQGKNQFELKNYDQAEASYLKSKSLSSNIDVVLSLYDVYYQTQEYAKAIPIVKELAAFNDDYREDLANLYVRTQQYQEALSVLDELDALYGRSKYRENLRKQIITETGDSSSEIVRLEQNIQANPDSESDFLNLIYLYSDSGDAQKAFATAKRMQTLFPESELVHLALYKFYLSNNNTQEAVASMEIIMRANTIDSDSKLKVLQDFLNVADQNPQYEKDLDKALLVFASEAATAQSLERLGAYYLSKGKQAQALKFYAQGVRLEPDNFELLKNTLLLQLDTKRPQEALTLVETTLELFPTQALLYLIKGVALLETDQPQKAVSVLEEGLDYVIEDPIMERDFYEQLSLAYQQLNNTEKATQYAKKAKDLG